jgi:hypothetical protein
MPDLKLRTLLPLGALVATLAACGDGAGGVTPPAIVPITSGTWYMHTANDEALPTVISERFIGAVFEEVYLDSSWIAVDVPSGTWEQRFWTRVHLQQLEDRRDVVVDEGTFLLTENTYTFVSSLRARIFSVGLVSATELLTNEPMALHTGAPTVLGRYRPTPP